MEQQVKVMVVVMIKNAKSSHEGKNVPLSKCRDGMHQNLALPAPTILDSHGGLRQFLLNMVLGNPAGMNMN